MMRCIQCEVGTMVPGTAPMTSDREGVLAVLRNIPAHVCDRCGASTFDAEIAEQAIAQMGALRARGTDVAIDVFQPAAVANLAN